MPDDLLRVALYEAAQWHHCTELPEQQLLECAANGLIKTASFGHFKGLESFGASIRMRYDE